MTQSPSQQPLPPTPPRLIARPTRYAIKPRHLPTSPTPQSPTSTPHASSTALPAPSSINSRHRPASALLVKSTSNPILPQPGVPQ